MSHRQPILYRTQMIAQGLREHMERFGYQTLETPIIDMADLFLTKAGDQIIDKLFTFERRGQQLALRPEFTAAAAHQYAKTYPDSSPVVRWQFSGAIFEDDPADHTSDYQRYNVGAELIGMAGPEAEAEIVSMAVSGVTTQGITGWQLVIGHVGLTRHLISRFNLGNRLERVALQIHRSRLESGGKQSEPLKATIRKILQPIPEDKIERKSRREFSFPQDANNQENTHNLLQALLTASPKDLAMGVRTQDDIAQRLVEKHNQMGKEDQLMAAMEFLSNWEAVETTPTDAFKFIESIIAPADSLAYAVLSEWRQTIDLLDGYGIPAEQVHIQPDLARNWDYYTGLVFEIRTNDGLLIAGGGRYDELVRLLGDHRDIPAVGFAYYLDHLLTALPPDDTIPRQILKIVVHTDHIRHGIAWAQGLRERSLLIELSLTDDIPENATLFIDRDGNLNTHEKVYLLDQIDAVAEDLRS